MKKCPRYKKGRPPELDCSPDQSVIDVMSIMTLKSKYQHVYKDFITTKCKLCCHEANIT
jgi:hypothetical protein